MSISDSNLSKYNQFNTDMTVSVTEAALNSQLIHYLASVSTSENPDDYRVKVYILSYVDEEGKPVQMSVDKTTDYSKLPQGFPEDFYNTVKALTEKGNSLYSELDKLDLFNITSGTKAVLNLNGSGDGLSGDAEKIQTAAGYYLRYGLLMEDGIPDSILTKLLAEKDPKKHDSILKLITLQPNTRNVLFKQFFRNICAFQITTSASGVYPNMKVVNTLSKTEQSADQTWYFPFNISLDFRAADYNNCSNEVQQKIKSMAEVPNPDDVFNISQLALDLQTLSTTMSPTIEGFEHDIDSYLLSCIRSYFDRLDKAGQTVFGSVITTKPASSVNYLFTPAMRNYHISPRTLDYLIGFGNEKIIPNLDNDNNLPWDSDNDPLIAANNPNNAAIAISAVHLLPFISSIMRPVLNFLPNKIEMFADDPVWKDHFEVTTKVTPLYGDPDFATNAEPGNPVFMYKYSNSDETDRHLMWQPPLPTPVASLKLKHRYDVDVSGRPGNYDFDGVKGIDGTEDTTLPAFIFDFRLKGWLMVDYNTNEGTQGTYFDQTTTMAIGIRIDSQTGNIDFVKGIKTVDNNPPGLPQNWWVKFMSAQHIQKYVSTLEEQLKNIMSNIEKYSIDKFVKSVNSQIGFVMPGNKTFTFVYDKPDGKVNAISKSGDLYLFGNYVQELAK